MSVESENNQINKPGRKVDSSIENPIDNFMINTSEFLSPYFKSLNYTPNGITTMSLIFGIASLYHLYYHNMLLFGIFFVLAYLFDCTDGYYARKYNMVSDGGDKYDHIKDLFVVLATIYILYNRYNILEFPVLILIVAVFCVLSMISVGCHEKITKPENKSDTLKVFDILTPNRENCSKYINYIRFFGPGTLVFVVIAAVVYLNSYSDETIIGGGKETFNALTNFDINMDMNSSDRIRYILDVAKPFNGFTQVSTNPFL